MNQFIAKFSEQIEGVLSGFDRLVFRGTLRGIAYELGMKTYLWHSQILLKDFGRHVEQTSQALKAAATEVAQRNGRPVQFLRSSQESKEELVAARRKCLYIYQYWQHPVLGFLHARIQTWFPFSIQICLNGREWLARQMDQAHLNYVCQDNCFLWILPTSPEFDGSIVASKLAATAGRPGAPAQSDSLENL